jgi:hypothetical protein
VLSLLAASAFTFTTLAQEPPRVVSPEVTKPTGATNTIRRRNTPPKIELTADDKAAFPPAPAGFDTRRDGIAQGKTEPVNYESKIVGVTRRMIVYTPPGYSPEKKYPVLYLLHGIGDDEMTWWKEGRADAILDNLHADGKVTPMIVVMPNGRADKDLTPRSPWGEQGPAFAAFERELLEDCPSICRVALFRAGRARTPRAGGPLDGWWSKP